MSRTDYLSLLRQENIKRSAPYSNLVKREKPFARFTGFSVDIKQLKQQDCPSVLVAVEPFNQIEPQPLAPMTSEQKRALWEWLTFIQEEDATVLADVIDQCETNIEARQYFIGRTHEILAAANNPDMHCCDECKNLSTMGVCRAAVKLDAMPSYRPVLGRRFDHRCPEWKPP